MKSHAQTLASLSVTLPDFAHHVMLALGSMLAIRHEAHSLESDPDFRAEFGHDMPRRTGAIEQLALMTPAVLAATTLPRRDRR